MMITSYPRCGAILGLVLLLAIPLSAEPPKAVQPKIVKIDGLIAAIKEQKGKVVVVDFWADG
jgi:hypothetical protein